MKKWYCEYCYTQFDEPIWLVSEEEEIPTCPECRSMYIDLNNSLNGTKIEEEN